MRAATRKSISTRSTVARSTPWSTNGGQAFSVDEQNLATKELQARFDEVLKPQAAVARITGDWSRTYQAAIDYLKEAGPEEKASAVWAGQLKALQEGYDTSVKQNGTLPKGIAGDPVADYLARTEDGTATGNSARFQFGRGRCARRARCADQGGDRQGQGTGFRSVAPHRPDGRFLELRQSRAVGDLAQRRAISLRSMKCAPRRKSSMCARARHCSMR